MARNEIKKAIESIMEGSPNPKIDYSPNPDFGDYSTNVALQEKLNPNEVAKKLQGFEVFEKVEAKNGFINFFLSKKYLQNKVKEILKQKNKFGSLTKSKGKSIQVEFISANPTGPLTLGNGRGGFCGDVLANVLKKAGFKVEREYYLNDRGVQVKALGHSVLGDDQAVYKGVYIKNLQKQMELDLVKFKDSEKVGEMAVKIVFNKMIKPTIKRMGIKYDVWFSEKSLYKKKKVATVLEILKKKGLAYVKDGALWFASTKFGDDKDRVLVKADGEETYLASDIAYIKDKKDRGFDKIIYFWGADHHGYVGRMKSAALALGYNPDDFIFLVMQLVNLFKDGKEVRMSKREGVYVLLDELLDEVGVDATRFFFLTRTYNTHLNFDLDLAKSRSQKNPVFYVQYAHARMQSILAKLKTQNSKLKITSQNLNLLNHPSELALIKQLIKLPEVVEDTASDYQVQRLPQYAMDLATAFHRFYTDCHVINKDNKHLSQARLALVKATQITLKNTLDLMGITAPNKM